MDRIVELIETIYQAGADSSLWATVLSETAVLTGSQSCTLFEFDLGQGVNRTSRYHGSDIAFAERFGTECSRLNPHIRRMASLPAGSVVADYMLMERCELLRSEFYRLWYKPQDITWSMGCCIQRSADSISSFALRRHGTQAQAYGSEEVRLMTLLSTHLQRAGASNARLRRGDVDERLGLAALAEMRDGIVLLGEGGRVIFTNAEATRILADGGLRLTVRGLATDDNRARTLLKRTIDSALDGSPGLAERGGCVRIEREEGRRPIVALISGLPVAAGLADGLPGPCAMVVLVDLDHQPRATQRRLQEVFALTRSEAEVAMRISNGLTVQEIAGDMQWSVATVKSYLKKVFQKTGTHRQPELMRLILASAGPVRLPG